MPRGAKLVVTAMVVFLWPLLAGILGAYWVGQFAAPDGGRGWWQFGGLVAGLLVGVAVAKVLVAWIGFRTSDQQDPNPERERGDSESEPGAQARGHH